MVAVTKQLRTTFEQHYKTSRFYFSQRCHFAVANLEELTTNASMRSEFAVPIAPKMQSVAPNQQRRPLEVIDTERAVFLKYIFQGNEMWDTTSATQFYSTPEDRASALWFHHV